MLLVRVVTSRRVCWRTNGNLSISRFRPFKYEPKFTSNSTPNPYFRQVFLHIRKNSWCVGANFDSYLKVRNLATEKKPYFRPKNAPARHGPKLPGERVLNFRLKECFKYAVLVFVWEDAKLASSTMCFLRGLGNVNRNTLKAEFASRNILLIVHSKCQSVLRGRSVATCALLQTNIGAPIHRANEAGTKMTLNHFCST